MKQNYWQLSLLFVFLSIGLLSISACGGEGGNDKEKLNRVVAYAPGEPNNLNPFNTYDAMGRRCMETVFQPLINLDVYNGKLVPVLTTALPVVKTRENGNVTMDFEIRPEAKWDNGDPITAEDVNFSLKLMKTPKVDNTHLRIYFENIVSIELDKENPKKFTLVCEKPYMAMESALTDFNIIPAFVYDEKGILKDYTVEQLVKGGKEIKEDPKLLAVAENFNSPKFQREILAGSGSYTLKKWETGQRLTFERKKDWWGEGINDNHWFNAYPDELVYEVIADATTGVVALKSGKIDVMHRIDPYVFTKELKKDKGFMDSYRTESPTQFLYLYYGMNMRHPKFSDVRVRQAMRYIMDVPAYSDAVFYGLAERVTTFIHPSKKEYINPDLKFYEQDLDKALALLNEAGWKDTDGNGLLDKEVDGERVDFKVDFRYANVAVTSEKGVLMFKEYARKIGIQIDANPQDFRVMSQDLTAHNFEMYVGIWGSSSLESDPKQIWHSESANGGNNYVGFGTPRSDELIESLRSELDREKRMEIYKEFEQIIDDEVPFIFLFAPQNRIAISKKFSNVKPIGKDPGYVLTDFKLKK